MFGLDSRHQQISANQVSFRMKTKAL